MTDGVKFAVAFALIKKSIGIELKTAENESNFSGSINEAALADRVPSECAARFGMTVACRVRDPEVDAIFLQATR